MSSGDGDNTSKDSALKSLADHVTYERLEKDLAAVKHDISTLTEQITDALNAFSGETGKQARRGYRQARENVDAALSDVHDRGNAAMEAAQEAASSIEETLGEAIQERPIAAVGLALGLGFLIGVTWRR